MAMMTNGISVATTQDLNAALGTMDAKLEEYRKVIETNITDFLTKLRANTERIDTAEREQMTSLESLKTDMRSLQAGTVTNANFRQQINIFEQRFDHERDQGENKLEQLKLAIEKEITSSVGNLRLKAETLNANCIVLTERCKELEEIRIPAMRADIEEQKQKRLSETQRLETDIEKMKEICDQKISHTAAALRFYVTATATKLREELAPLKMAKEMEEDIRQNNVELRKQVKASDEMVSGLRDQLVKHKADLDTTCDRYTAEINQHTKSIKVQEINLTNLQNGVASDLNDMREHLRNDRVNLQTEMADCRAAAARSAVSNDNAIQAVAQEINPLRQFRERMETVHIEKFISQVKEWQTGLLPQLTGMVKDVDERVKKVTVTSQKDHDLVMELKSGYSAIRGHFKMFHAIAAGLDDRPLPGEATFDSPGREDTRLPAISSPYSSPGQKSAAGSAGL